MDGVVGTVIVFAATLTLPPGSGMCYPNPSQGGMRSHTHGNTEIQLQKVLMKSLFLPTNVTYKLEVAEKKQQW